VQLYTLNFDRREEGEKTMAIMKTAIKIATRCFLIDSLEPRNPHPWTFVKTVMKTATMRTGGEAQQNHQTPNPESTNILNPIPFIRRHDGQTQLKAIQESLGSLIDSPPFQFLIALMISANFVANIVEFQVKP
jgi:hypothetical protein